MAHIIVVGNEKGGSGKSTTSMHIATALVRMGHKVGAVDLDLRQQSLGRYVENRKAFIRESGIELACPDYRELPNIDPGILAEGQHPQAHKLEKVVEELHQISDFVLIDCPGSHTRLSQMAHAMADTLITPLNDSFVDFDLLARMDGHSGKILGPSIYSEMVWSARQLRAASGLKPMEWIVVRNRLGTQQMHNKKKVGKALSDLSKRIGFRVTNGFSERVVFRELFPQGLTLLDLKDAGVGNLSLSNIAARQEVRDLMREIALPGVEINF
ncbi:division plane positioning ATPase MipZ [Palleronia caenipelagi]|uniref:ATPase n=1 Tax=Palleronia caenipelagi TaxID=2489174 RepID=A0A547PRI1_9RHOB|nr:division plane positioning ATPase MipZ [Palleronia caenipelagi]TRD16644.1 ATPase [Palleronia caenipelagi]